MEREDSSRESGLTEKKKLGFSHAVDQGGANKLTEFHNHQNFVHLISHYLMGVTTA